MTTNTEANAAQSENWNGDSGLRWVAAADERDQVLAPVADALFGAAAVEPGARVLDIGCGCGATSLLASAFVGPEGSVNGIDLSEPMLGVARDRAAAGNRSSTTFIQGDAQTYPFAPESFDVAIGRFGTMFFADPVAAFTNIGNALAPDGRLALATWQPLVQNEWLIVPGAVLLNHTAMPDQPANQPGMFAQSDPETVTAILAAAGFTDVAVTAALVTFSLGATPDDAVGYLSDAGPGRLMLESIEEGPARDAAIDDVRVELANHIGPTGVELGGGIWLITARRADR